MPEYFKNNKHIFEANINETPYGINIKIGGKTYKDCINISIDKDSPTKAKIPHLQSEQECSFSSILDRGDTVDFIKASLQFVYSKYPTIKYFEFDDMSNIDCGNIKQNISPKFRKLSKPFSLAHLYIALKGETWYENNFGAKLMNKELYKKYRSASANIDKLINIEYEKFKWMNNINGIQDKIILQYYSIDKTWRQFFNDIPKEDRCNALFNWVPNFINELLEYTYIPNGWYIDIEIMPRTKMEIVDKLTIKGGRNTRKSRNIIKFNNDRLFKGGYIFDGD